MKSDLIHQNLPQMFCVCNAREGAVSHREAVYSYCVCVVWYCNQPQQHIAPERAATDFPKGLGSAIVQVLPNNSHLFYLMLDLINRAITSVQKSYDCRSPNEQIGRRR